MAHYAFLNEDNIVIQVIGGRDENELGIDWEEHYSNSSGFVAKRTSYNTYAGEHRLGGEAYRKNYAGIGFFYDEELDAFIPPQCHPEAILNESTCLWSCENVDHADPTLA